MSTSFTNTPAFAPDEIPLPPKLHMAEEEFVEWALAHESNAEWVDGEVVIMSPTSRTHSQLKVWLLAVMQQYCEEKQAGVVLEDMMLRFSRRRRVRVPDIFFVARDREHIIEPTMLRQPPDMAVEIVSPDSVARDWREKYVEYEAFGIREYWIIDPQAQSFEVHALNSDHKYVRLPVPEGVVHSTVIPGFWVKSTWFAAPTRPTVREVMHLLGVA